MYHAECWFNSTSHKVSLISSKGIGKENAIKFSLYFTNQVTAYIYLGKNNLLSSYQSMQAWLVKQGEHTDISLSKLSDNNLGERYNNRLKNTKPKDYFAIESYKYVSKFGFDYSYENCYEYYACHKLFNEFNCTRNL